MSTNCIQCIKRPRTGSDLLCDTCRRDQEKWQAEVQQTVITRLRAWLGYDGQAFFQMCVEQYGNIASAVWTEGGLPHPVHLREGMAVRNFMRDMHMDLLGETLDSSIEHYYDDNWVGAVMAVIACENQEPEEAPIEHS